jgi:hypothetical protein
MNMRFILGTLGAMIVTASVLLAGALIWIATTGPQLLATGRVSHDVSGVLLAAVSRALSLVL